MRLRRLFVRLDPRLQPSAIESARHDETVEEQYLSQAEAPHYRKRS